MQFIKKHKQKYFQYELLRDQEDTNNNDKRYITTKI